MNEFASGGDGAVPILQIDERAGQQQLANVDPLHGGAETFLTISNLLVLLGFAGVGSVRQGSAGGMNKS